MIYLDSSALVKRYVKEEGTESVEAIVTGSRMMATSRLTYPEVISALTRKQRAGEIDAKPYERALAQFEQDWKRVVVIEFLEEMLPEARAMIQKHALRAGGTVHLCAAMWTARSAKLKVQFVSSDRNLLRAAETEELEVVDPSPTAGAPQ